MIIQSHLFLWIAAAVFLATVSAKDNDISWAELSNGKDFPLVGFGVGNLQHELIPELIEKALTADKKTILIDTSHASKNEKLIRDGISKGLKNKGKGEVHVMTKVWYTHLGYQRTIMSVKESLENLNHPDIKVHLLIHWPRCNDDIPWMNCEAEENDLPFSVKNAGPPPHDFKETAFMDSWKALEDIYLGKVKLGLPKIESIGVSNFDLNDLKALEKMERITPHILQGNVWSYLFDPHMMEYCREHHILFQAYNVVNGVFYDREFNDAPNAIRALNDVKDDVSGRDSNGGNYTLPQLVLKWLVQNEVSVIPRTSKPERLAENSAVAIAAMPELDDLELNTIQSAVAGLLRKEDIKPPLAEWINRAERGLMHIFWLHPETGEEIPVMEHLAPGESFNVATQRGHKFVVYYEDTDIRKEMTVSAHHGQQQRFDLNAAEDEL